MTSSDIAFFSYLGGSICFLGLSLFSFFQSVRQNLHISFAIAASASSIWSLAIALHYDTFNFSFKQLILLDIVRYGSWISATLFTLKYQSGKTLPNKIIWYLQGSWIAGALIISALPSQSPLLFNKSNSYIWLNLILSICSLIAIEQLYRNCNKSRYLKLFCLIFGGLFSYDIFLFSYSLSYNLINQQLWQARGIINGMGALIITIGIFLFKTSKVKSQLSISRPAAFYTTSMTFSGIFLAIMAIGSYYIQRLGGSWSGIIATSTIFVGLLITATLFLSESVRSSLNVWINKHFFRHKYDYRVEWIKLIRSLSQPSENDNFQTLAIKTLASTFKSPAGGLWLKEGKFFTLQASHGLALPDPPRESIDSDFAKAINKHEWVFSPLMSEHKKNHGLNHLLPKWIMSIPNLWLVTPLFVERELLGFAILTKPNANSEITWEDLDLLKAAGRQIASYLDRHRAADLLAQSRQFDAFNKLSAFIMHDLKNLIAQQALVVENAAKHKDNPAFIEDAINTIDNSVVRMNNLLQKLQHEEHSEFRTIELNLLLIEIVNKSQQLDPRPTLHRYPEEINVTADPEHLLMVLTHIVKNAQEATSREGFVDITLEKEEHNAIIQIEDNGSGMTDHFIKNELFKPFSTTKSGKGMGIGVYQTKEYLESLGGSITVDSHPNQGTQFRITIPTVKA